ncbi:MAG: acetolactate synthase small subunit [Ruminococcus sp.]|nr:acetolactate synthase small subunit [Ruminococcus sp.]
MQYTLSILVENQAGALSKISGLFSRRSFNIDSLAVGVTNDPAISRITIVANGDEYVVEQLEKQLNKLIPVIKVKRFEQGEYISRELSLIKVHSSSAKRFEVIKIAELMGAKIVDVAQSTITVEFCETAEKTNTLIDLLKPYGIREIVRTGTIAIDKGSVTAAK